MDYEVLLERVRRWSGIPRKRDAQRAVAATTRALRECLFDDEARLIEPELASQLVRIFRDASRTGVDTQESFYERVAFLERLPKAIAVEHAQATCQALASLMSVQSVERLSRALPHLAPLFIVARRESQPLEPRSTGMPTLAEGHPGSEHPLSEGRASWPCGQLTPVDIKKKPS
jgi:uncharacterized protein (DUF2267 family)